MVCIYIYIYIYIVIIWETTSFPCNLDTSACMRLASILPVTHAVASASSTRLRMHAYYKPWFHAHPAPTWWHHTCLIENFISKRTRIHPHIHIHIHTAHRPWFHARHHAPGYPVDLIGNCRFAGAWSRGRAARRARHFCSVHILMYVSMVVSKHALTATERYAIFYAVHALRGTPFSMQCTR